MKRTVKKTGVIAILAIAIMIMAAGCGKKETKVATPVPTNDYYAFKKITNVDKDIYFVTEEGFELTKSQYDYLFDLMDREDIYTMNKLLFDNVFLEPHHEGASFTYKYDLTEVGTFNRFWSIVKVKEETYKNTEEKNEELDRDGAAEQALNEIDYEPVAVRVAHDSDEDMMWRVSLFSKDDGEEAIYTNVYMTKKGKTVLITRVAGDAQYLGVW
ncbi:MAG: hypothetical protein K2I03_05395 [Lachnospiraceae bacterium]|nr:hypothetical protein [Lachnospiraceae bacterium]